MNLPFFSIIIPAYGRSRQLANCLDSLARLQYPRHHFEVIVVDDGSNVPLEPVIARFRQQLDLSFIRQLHAGPAAARNTGAAQARGEFLAFTDDDCTPAPHWLQSLGTRFAAGADCAVGGQTFNALPDNLYSTASQLLIAYLYSYYNVNCDQARFLTSNNLALPANRFRAIGGFDTSFSRAAAEDREFCDRWLNHGYRMTFAPEVRVYHAHPLTFRSFWRQHVNYGRGAWHFHQVRAQRGLGGVKLEPASFYLNLLRYPFRAPRQKRRFSLAALLWVSQIANAAGFFWERSRKKMERE